MKRVETGLRAFVRKGAEKIMCEKFRNSAGAAALNQSVVEYRRKQQENAFNMEAADAILPRYMRQTIVSLQKAWIDRRISSKTLRLTTTTDENNCSSSAENDKRRSYLDWNGNYTTNDLNSKSSNLTLRNTFPLHKKKLSTAVLLEATTNDRHSPANPAQVPGASFSSLSDDREQRNIRLVQSDATADDVHPSATLRSSLGGPGNRRQPKTAETKQLLTRDSSCSYRRSCADSSADLPSLFGVRLVSGRRKLPLQQKRQKMQSTGAERLLDSGGICSEQKTKTPSPSPRGVYGREVLGRCRQPTQSISNPNDAGIICISREAKLSSDKTDASQPVRASSRWSREDARNNVKTARLLHSAQPSRCPSSNERPRSVLQRPTTSFTRAFQPRKLCAQSARRQQTVIRKVFQGFMDYDARKEKRTNNNEAPPSTRRKPSFRTTDNGAFNDLFPSTVTSEDEVDDDYDDFHSKSRLDAINHYSTTFRRRCEEMSKARGKRVCRGRIVEWDDANGVSIPNRKSPSRNPSTRDKELDAAAAAAKPQAKDSAVREEEEALGDGSRCYAAGHGGDAADDSNGANKVVLRQTILERMVEADDGDAKNERIVAWLLGLRYDHRERLPSPDILEEMTTQTDTAIHIVYDGD